MYGGENYMEGSQSPRKKIPGTVRFTFILIANGGNEISPF